MMRLKFKYAMKKSIHIKFLNYSYDHIIMVNVFLAITSSLKDLVQVINMKFKIYPENSKLAKIIILHRN